MAGGRRGPRKGAGVTFDDASSKGDGKSVGGGGGVRKGAGSAGRNGNGASEEERRKERRRMEAKNAIEVRFYSVLSCLALSLWWVDDDDDD